jgi:hypothetical protein
MSGGGSGGGTNTVVQNTQLPDWVQAIAQSNIATAGTLAQQPYQQYPGQELAPFNADQTNAFSTIRDAVGATQPIYQTAEAMLRNLPQTTAAWENPYLKQVEGDVVSNLQRQGAVNAETINANAANANAFGGTRQGVQSAINASETQRNIGQATNQIQAQGWNTAMDAVLKAAPQMANIAGAGQNALLQGAGAELSVGGLEQGQTQAGIAQSIADYQAARNWPYQQLGLMESALTSTPYGGTTTSQQPYHTNLGAQLLGTAGTAIPVGAGLYDLGKWAGLIGTGSSAAPLSATGLTATSTPFDIAGVNSALDTGTLASLGDITASAAAASPFLAAGSAFASAAPGLAFA